jgi:hypothetical protein
MRVNPIRELRWNRLSFAGPERHEWCLLVINTNEKTVRILQIIYEQLQPIEGLITVARGAVSGSGLRYRAVRFSTSHSGMPEWKQVYDGPVTRDRTLYDRQTADGLATYIDNEMQRLAR